MIRFYFVFALRLTLCVNLKCGTVQSAKTENMTLIHEITGFAVVTWDLR